MQRVTENDSVSIVYEGLLQNGEKFESSEDTGPLQFQLGTGSVLPAFEEAVVGMAVQEMKTITVPAESAFGKKNEELILTVDRKNFPDKTIAPGMVLGMKMESEGQEHNVPATILAVDEKSVTVDFNHPLAGQDLTYQITLLSIDTPAKESAGQGCGCPTKEQSGKKSGSCGCP